ncbi:PTS sugar transporter subunit IIB [Salibacterium aidingense]|uniref:PTS sugar transporter subunit IIB n=1 Tax=Salibacterium aidingense TaxID=384933 RepID=UPI003BC4763D
MNIVLCCNAGMSTSILVNKMQESAKERELDIDIIAVPSNDVINYVEEADVLLLGPQVRYQLQQMKKLGEENGFKVDAINSVHYGMANGEEILNMAIKMADTE